MQEMAITIGQGMDEAFGEGTEAVSVLEEYCECVWQCSQAEEVEPLLAYLDKGNYLVREILEEKYLVEVSNALLDILPPWVTYKISASVKAVPGDMEELPSEFKVTETPTCKFVKPRAKKEES
jgi:hypothetical protein